MMLSIGEYRAKGSCCAGHKLLVDAQHAELFWAAMTVCRRMQHHDSMSAFHAPWQRVCVSCPYQHVLHHGSMSVFLHHSSVRACQFSCTIAACEHVSFLHHGSASACPAPW